MVICSQGKGIVLIGEIRGLKWPRERETYGERERKRGMGRGRYGESSCVCRLGGESSRVCAHTAKWKRTRVHSKVGEEELKAQLACQTA